MASNMSPDEYRLQSLLQSPLADVSHHIALVTAVATADDSGATSSGDVLPAILKGQATKPTAHDTQQLSSRLYYIRMRMRMSMFTRRTRICVVDIINPLSI